MMIVPIGWTISGVIMGRLADLLGRKTVLLISLIASTLSYGLCLIALKTYFLGLFIMARLVIGLGSGSFSLVQTIMTDIAPDNLLPRYMGWVNAASAIGFVVGALMTMFFSYVMGNIQDYYLMPFYGGFFICFINTLLVMYCVSETYTPKKLTDKLFEFNFSKNLYSLLIIFVQLEIAWGIFLQSSPILLSQVYSANSLQIATYYFFNGLCAVISIFIIQPMFEKTFRYEDACQQLALITAIIMALLSIKTNFIVFTTLMITMTFFEFLLFTAILVQISKTAPKEEKGMVMGMVSSLIGVSFLISDLFMMVVSENLITLNFLIAAMILPFYSSNQSFKKELISN